MPDPGQGPSMKEWYGPINAWNYSLIKTHGYSDSGHYSWINEAPCLAILFYASSLEIIAMPPN